MSAAPRSGGWLLPAGVDPSARTVVLARLARAFVDGYVAVLLPAYLLALGHPAWAVGVIGTATLLGSAAATLGVGAFGHRAPERWLLPGAGLLMAATGLGFAGVEGFWPLLAIAFVGTLNPSSGDVSVFLPLEHARLAAAASGDARTALFARYGLAASLAASFGALAAAVPTWLAAGHGVAPLATMRAMFLAYAACGAVLAIAYRRLPAPARAGAAAGGDASSTDAAARAATPATPAIAAPATAPPARAPSAAPLGPSRAIVVRLAALFAVDAFAGGLVVNSLVALWLMQRFGLALPAVGQLFFATGVLSALSMLAAPAVARRIGLVPTMVFTHLPANVCLVGAALAPALPLAVVLLLVRSLLSQMDVPTRSAFVMAAVTPPERAAAASFTAVPRSLAAAFGPALGAALVAAGWTAAPLVAAGLLKAAYDLALWRLFGRMPLRGG